ncbi:putative C-type lectin domain family 20 member A isoform X2 [Tachysurus fulvidraco]|uniref:putative C-type lectin domain family 20 member A isoform X2 n=1 Tax=Tachysurus fulvidraco TaxID=1234273 RepID=UPI001FEE5ABE|nr:putative C-type lectin domain family 20 member A isoform X2 [Tachysurus fulvidraco]
MLLFFTVPLVLSVTRQYYLIQQGKTWSDAQAYCRDTHTDLAIIDSNDNMVRLQKEAQRQQFGSSAWIGLYNPINSWCWSMGNKPLGSVQMEMEFRSTRQLWQLYWTSELHLHLYYYVMA